MRFLMKSTLILISLLMIVGCRSSSYVVADIVDDDKDVFTVFAHSAMQQKADVLALNRAKDVCARKTANVKIVSYQSAYNGLNAEQRKLVESAGWRLP